MKKQIKKEKNRKSHGISASFVIIIAFILAESFFYFILGKSSNFEGNNSGNRPVNLFGVMFKGGFVVPIILTLLLTVIILSLERFFALNQARGEDNLVDFIYKLRIALKNGVIAEAKSLCALQKGLVAAIVDEGLKKYNEMETATIAKEQKIKEIETEMGKATALQLPVMQQNLPIIATISTLGTLVGLFGTVLGMIKSFQALGVAGAVDSVALSVGISEALINTAAGIVTGASSIVSYSYFSNKIDQMTYAIDEIGFVLTQIYAEAHRS